MNRWRATVHRWWVRYLLLALCCVPLLGALHQVVHGSASGFAPAHSSSPADLGELSSAEFKTQRSADAAALPAGAWLPQLFAAHGSDADCEVFDQLSHGQPLPSVPAVTLPAQLVLSWRQPSDLAWPGVAPVQAQARGPPLTV